MQLGGESAERGTSQISSWRKEWENRAAWVGCVPQPPPRLCPGAPSQALAAATAAQALWLFPLRSLWAFPLLVLGLWVHPPFPAGSIPAADCWLAGPGQEASSLCSPQAEWHHPGVSPGVLQLCSLNLIPTSSLPPQMWYRPKYCPLCMGRGLLHHPPHHPQPSAESLPTVAGLPRTLYHAQPMVFLRRHCLPEPALNPAEAPLHCI